LHEKKLREQLIARGAPRAEVEKADSVLDSEALTIGFARRFATYKRATLILKDMQRLERILLDKERPVQIIFAGKAHPRDNMGKELIKRVINLGRDDRFRSKIVFLEDYDINIARYLVQGVDVWLNTPIRPQEASGTSGMKVVPNGALNISVLDGWWPEAFNGNNGWAIGKGEEYQDPEYQDEVESLSLYNILEQEVIPQFYARGADGIPREWVRKIKESMKTILPQFNTNRMVKEYTEMYYLTAYDSYVKFSKDNFKASRELEKWKLNIRQKWQQVTVDSISHESKKEIIVGSQLKAKAVINLGELKPADVQVELYFGNLNQKGDIEEGAALPMLMVEDLGNGKYTYEGRMLCLKSGQFGFTVRVIPLHADMPRKYESRMITWA